MNNIIINNDDELSLINSIDIDHVRDVVSKLTFLAKAKKGQKIDTQNFTIYDDTFLNNAIRYVTSHESRSKTYEFINNNCNHAIELAARCFCKKETYYYDLAMLIITALKTCLKELPSNFPQTYRNDSKYVSDIQTMISLIEAKLLDLERKVEMSSGIKKEIDSKRECKVK